MFSPWAFTSSLLNGDRKSNNVDRPRCITQLALNSLFGMEREVGDPEVRDPEVRDPELVHVCMAPVLKKP